MSTAPLIEQVDVLTEVPHSVTSKGPWQILWAKLRKNRAAMIAMYLLIGMYGIALFAGFFSPYSYDTINKDHAYHPPMVGSIHFFDQAGNVSWPFVYGTLEVDPSRKAYIEDTSTTYPIRFFIRRDTYYLLWVFPSNIHLVGVDAPGHFFLLGSDQFGRDILSRIIFGGRISLSVGIIGIIISTVIGMLVGGAAGYFGGVVEFVSMRVVELLLALPSLYFILVLRQSFGSNLTSAQAYLIIVIILSFVGWAAQARVIRGMVLSIKEREYVVAAQALGFNPMWIVVKHILPNTLSFVIVTATLSVPFYILGEVALSFLGVGITEPDASWGNMLQEAQNVRILTDFWWVMAPGVFIFIAVMAWNIFGDGLRDAADPRTQR